MEFLTAKQAAERFGLTQRRVQEMCRNGEINGAVRHGREWLVPADYNKDGVSQNDTQNNTHNKRNQKSIPPITRRVYSGITDIYKTAGTADIITSALQDGFSRDIFASQVAFYRGDYGLAISLAQKHLDENEKGVAHRASVGMQIMLGSIAVGDVALWRKGRDYIAGSVCENDTLAAVRDFYIAAGACAVSDGSLFPSWFKQGNFLPLPRQSFPAAFYNYVKYLYTVCHDDEQRGEHQSAIELMRNMPNIIEPMISVVCYDGVIIMEIYLRLLCALAYHISGRDNLAISHIDKALDLAMPDRLFSPLAEYRRRFGFLMDDRIAEKYPSALNDIKRISKELNDGWVVLFNRYMGRHVTNKLSTREWQAARLATYGLSNKEIAERMGITVNAVKQALRLAMDKTGAESRADIAKYI